MKYFTKLMYNISIFKILYIITFTNILAIQSTESIVISSSAQNKEESLLEKVKDIKQTLMSIFPILSLIDGLCVQSNKEKFDGKDYLNLGECEKIIRFELTCSAIREVPKYLTSFKHIKYLNFYDNELTSSCFVIITQLITLTTLNIRENLIEEIPESISKLINLQKLFIGRNIFTHTIAKFLYNLNLLKTIEFSGLRSVNNGSENRNTEGTTTFIDINNILKIKTIESLMLSYVDLSRFNFDNERYYIKRLTFFFCNLHTLPNSILKFNKLEYLNLENNEFRQVPQILSKLESLNELNLRRNYIISYENIYFHSLETLHIQWHWESKEMISINNTDVDCHLKYLHIYLYADYYNKMEFAPFTYLKGLYQYGEYKLEIAKDKNIPKNLEFLHIEGELNCDIIDNVSELKNLKELHLSFYANENPDYIKKFFSSLKNLKNLKSLSLGDYTLYTLLDDKISTLKNLETLYIVQFIIGNIECFSKFKNLKSVSFEVIDFCESNDKVNYFFKNNKINVKYDNCRFNFKIPWDVRMKYLWCGMIRKLK